MHLNYISVPSNQAVRSRNLCSVTILQSHHDLIRRLWYRENLDRNTGQDPNWFIRMRKKHRVEVDSSWRLLRIIISAIYVKMGKLTLPFVGMIMAELAQVGLIILSKQAMSQGMTNFIFIFYSNAIAALLLLPISFLIHRLLPISL